MLSEAVGDGALDVPRNGSGILPRVVIFASRQVLSEVVGDDALDIPKNVSSILPRDK